MKKLITAIIIFAGALSLAACDVGPPANDMTNRDPKQGPVYYSKYGSSKSFCVGDHLFVYKPEVGWNGNNQDLGVSKACQ